MGQLRYKGYEGSVEYSAEDNCLYGKVMGLSDGTLILYEGMSIEELRKDFEDAVDDYLIFCEDNGLKPEKSYTDLLNIEVASELHSRIAMLATKSGLSISSFIKKALEKQVAAML